MCAAFICNSLLSILTSTRLEVIQNTIEICFERDLTLFYTFMTPENLYTWSFNSILFHVIEQLTE